VITSAAFYTGQRGPDPVALGVTQRLFIDEKGRNGFHGRLPVVLVP